MNIDALRTAKNLVGFSNTTIMEGANLVHACFAIVALEKDFFWSGIVLGECQSYFLNLNTVIQHDWLIRRELRMAKLTPIVSILGIRVEDGVPQYSRHPTRNTRTKQHRWFELEPTVTAKQAGFWV